MSALRYALLLPLNAALLARAGIAELLPALGMLLLALRASGRLQLKPNRALLPLLSLPFIAQTALLPTNTHLANLLQIYAIGAHYLFWIAIQQILTTGRENGALPFSLGSIAAASLHLPPEQLWLPLLALPLLPFALLPADGGNRFWIPCRNGRLSWLLLWTVAVLIALGSNHWAENHRFRWRGWSGHGSGPLLGFSEVSDLNRQPGNWNSPRKNQIVLRLTGEGCAVRLSGRSYNLYRNGVWSVSGKSTPKEPTDQRVAHQIYGQHNPSLPWVWVESLLPLDGTLFLPEPLRSVAVLHDTLSLSNEGTLSLPHTIATPSPWLFQSGQPAADLPDELQLTTPPHPSDLAVPHELLGWLDSLSTEVWGDNPASTELEETVAQLRGWLFSTFEYRWSNPAPIDREPLRGFVAERRGYCDHFASLATLLLRSRGIRARYTKGYLPGVQIGNSCAVRRVEAHSWVEVWHQERWQTLEATPALGIEREQLPRWRGWVEWWKSGYAQLRNAIFHGHWRLWLEEGAEMSSRHASIAAVIAAGLAALWLLLRRWRRRGESLQKRLWPPIARLLHAEGVAYRKGENSSELLQKVEQLPHSKRQQELQQRLQEYHQKRWKL